MLDFEWIYPPHECFATDNKLLDTQTCDMFEYEVTLGISKSIAQLDSVVSFAFFDLHLSDYENYILSGIKIKDSNFLVSYSGLNGLEDQVMKFLSSVIDESQQGFISEQVAWLIIKLTSNIIGASAYNDAVVSMIAYNDGEDGYFPSWHVDKTHAEEMNLQVRGSTWLDTQNVFIVTLKGASTLYHPMDDQLRKQFNAIASETAHTYGYGTDLRYIPKEGLDKLFDLNNSSSAKFGQGSVHLAGYLHGAVHTTPTGAERLLLMVTPGEEIIINELRKKL